MFTHNLNPIIFSIGPLDIRWYSIAYILGFILAIWVLNYFRKKGEISLTKEEIYDFIFYLIIGVIIGGRLGHVLFWEPMYYLANPLKIFFVWEGGMAFHGGLIGAILAGWYFTNKKSIKSKITFLKIADIVSIAAMFAWVLGRLANFINGELWVTRNFYVMLM